MFAFCLERGKPVKFVLGPTFREESVGENDDTEPAADNSPVDAPAELLRRVLVALKAATNVSSTSTGPRKGPAASFHDSLILASYARPSPA